VGVSECDSLVMALSLSSCEGGEVRIAVIGSMGKDKQRQ